MGDEDGRGWTEIMEVLKGGFLAHPISSGELLTDCFMLTKSQSDLYSRKLSCNLVKKGLMRIDQK